MPVKKLVVSTYLQYVLIGAAAPALFAFVRQLGGVLLTSLLAGVLAYVLNPLVRWIEERGIPRVVAVLGVFAAPVAAAPVFALDDDETATLPQRPTHEDALVGTGGKSSPGTRG